MAKIFHKNKHDLLLIIPYKRSEEKTALLQIILTIKEKFFDIDQDFSDNYQLWNDIRNDKNFMSNQTLALKQSDELVAQTALLAAKEQKSANEATATFETISTDQIMKR